MSAFSPFRRYSNERNLPKLHLPRQKSACCLVLCHILILRMANFLSAAIELSLLTFSNYLKMWKYVGPLGGRDVCMIRLRLIMSFKVMSSE